LKIPEHTGAFLQKYFDKIFVITLDRAKERQESTRNYLGDIAFDFFLGADKLKMDLSTLIKDGIYDEGKAKQMNRYGKKMVLGHIACSLSHRNLYKHIIENKYQRVLIFEDDVIPVIESLKHIIESLNELPEDWELVYLGYNKHEIITPKLKRKQAFYAISSRLGLMKWNNVMVDNMLPKPFSKHLRVAGFHDCTHAYAVSYEGAKKLLEFQTPIAFNADDLLSDTVMKGHLNAFITVPKFFDQEQFTNPAQHSFIHH